jgi:uncharacterized Zn finger protein (UPF0148 family)
VTEPTCGMCGYPLWKKADGTKVCTAPHPVHFFKGWEREKARADFAILALWRLLSVPSSPDNWLEQVTEMRTLAKDALNEIESMPVGAP